jgi:hypothetical protein
VQRCRKLSLEDDAIDLQGLTEVAAKESATMSHLQYTVQQLRKRYGLYTAVTDKQREVTRLSAQLAWAELAGAEADATAAEQQLAELTAALQRAEAASAVHAQDAATKTQEREALYAARTQCERAEQAARTAFAAAEDHLASVKAPIAAENKPLRLQLEALAQRAITAAAIRCGQHCIAANSHGRQCRAAACTAAAAVYSSGSVHNCCTAVERRCQGCCYCHSSQKVPQRCAQTGGEQ